MSACRDCEIAYNQDGAYILYCSKHDAADELLQALEQFDTAIATSVRINATKIQQARIRVGKAILAARRLP